MINGLLLVMINKCL